MGGGTVAKEWKIFKGDQCLHCGSAAEVFTEGDGEYIYDSEDARCVECGCPGSVGVDDGRAYILWHDEPKCDCEWCKAHGVPSK